MSIIANLLLFLSFHNFLKWYYKFIYKLIFCLLIFVLGCCIYEKPRDFGESSSESDDDECEHCKGHVEKRRLAKTGIAPEENHLHPIGISFRFLCKGYLLM